MCSGRAGEDGCAREARVRVGWIQGEKSKRWAVCGLKTGQRLDVRGQRRDITERIYANIVTFGATS